MSKFRHCLSLSAFLAATTFATAQYSVMTNIAGWSSASYNWNHVGPYIQLAGFGGPSATVNSDLTGQSKCVSASVRGNGPGYPHNPNTSNNFTSYVDLSTVCINFSEFDTGTDDVYTGYDGGTTHSELHDHLTFHVQGANASTVTTIGFKRIVSGAMKQSGSYFDAHGEFLTNWSLQGNTSQISTVNGFVDIKLDSTSGYLAYINGTTGSGLFSTRTPRLAVQQGTMKLTGATIEANFDMSTNSWAYSGMDQAYTTYFQLVLPSNVTVSSSSNVFGTSQLYFNNATNIDIP